MRGALALAVVLALVCADGAAASARLHAFRSCTNLLTYAQRGGLRVIRDTSLVRPLPPRGPVPVSEGGGDGAAPAPAAGGGESSPTNVEEAGVDEPDWVKFSGTTLFAVSGGRLTAFDA